MAVYILQISNHPDAIAASWDTVGRETFATPQMARDAVDQLAQSHRHARCFRGGARTPFYVVQRDSPLGARRGVVHRLGDGTPVRLGMHVYDRADPRHVGRLDAVRSSVWATVTWLETGWKTADINLGELRKGDDA